MGGIESPVLGVSGVDKDSYKEEEEKKEERKKGHAILAMAFIGERERCRVSCIMDTMDTDKNICEHIKIVDTGKDMEVCKKVYKRY